MPHIRKKINELCSTGKFEKERILLETEELKLFFEMINPSLEEVIPIGKGEAAAISLAKVRGGIVASNNFNDIKIYLNRFGLEKLTTAEILIEARMMSIIDDYNGNLIWDAMLSKKRVLPTATFTDYMNMTDKR